MYGSERDALILGLVVQRELERQLTQLRVIERMVDEVVFPQVSFANAHDVFSFRD